MTGTLRCTSFHSVKGGVGKSTLSTALACTLAQEHPDEPVILIDMDLTGTSLSDVLRLSAPRWDGDQVQLGREPRGFWSHEESLQRIETRHGSPRDAAALGVPFLNDFLLWADPDWSTEHEIQWKALAWRMEGAPDNLRVIPSSALPEDLRRIIPVIFDEEHAAFLEARMEALLAALVPAEGTCHVVFDTPPTIPGLSRSVFSLGLRLGGASKRPLADDGYIPSRLAAAEVRWRIALVLSQDRQDLRAADRWMAKVSPEEQELVRLVINRVPAGRREELQAWIFGGVLGASGSSTPEYPTLANFASPLFVDDDAALHFFHRAASGPAERYAALLELVEDLP